MSNTPVSETEVKRFVLDWYLKLNVHPPLEEMLEFLADEELVMKMPERIFNGHSGFKEWYHGVDRFRNQSHFVKALKVDTHHSSATVEVITRWERSDSLAPNPDARLAFYAAQTWTVEQSPLAEKFRIVTYNVDYFLEEWTV